MRFISGLNEYSYVHNRPTLHNDPLGLCPLMTVSEAHTLVIMLLSMELSRDGLLAMKAMGPQTFPG
jgi:hypothetical protein